MTVKPNDKQEIGRRGEDAAARFLENGGYRIIVRNWRCPKGEIDIVAKEGDIYVFAEVKTASAASLTDPRNYITRTKTEKLAAAAQWYLAENLPDEDPYYRIDFLAVKESRDGISIKHFKAIDPSHFE